MARYFAWQANVVNDSGDVLALASVEVRDADSGSLVQLYSGIDSGTIGNPVTADSSGYVVFYAPAGRYTITATSGAYSRVWSNYQLGPYGVFATPTFSAGNFTGSGSMTVTVTSGDVVTYAYVIQGKLMTVMWTIVGITIGGTPDAQIRIAIPDGRAAAKTVSNPCFILDDNSTRETGLATVQASGTTINVTRANAGNYSASTNNTNLQGQITFEIS